MRHSLLAVFLLFTSSLSFTPAPPSRPLTSLSSSVQGITNTGKFYPETGKQVWDPLNLMNRLDSKGVAWFRAAEIKHGRVAMMANLGWLAQVNHFHFGGQISPTEGVSFADIAEASPFEAIGKIPDSGFYQILFIIGAVEGYQEMIQPHYTLPGGSIGDLGAARCAPERLERMQAVETKNGRLAMLGMASYIAASTIPGSVPNIPQFFVPH
ncbi:hypothetical protein TrVE_jg13509 [Triparma verrucosa]|uniref:Chlorophyll a-b binding protein, chloroplastic n=2 Tax=Triparma TaxID=722752 RepID=A0A9W7ESU9_9STRA|nr:hypothetical protein TrST_g13642 [Triparma strigata]GMI06246.1 hypothetical protein TrVE_jg13509 [Triparma verrucosa]